MVPLAQPRPYRGLASATGRRMPHWLTANGRGAPVAPGRS